MDHNSDATSISDGSNDTIIPDHPSSPPPNQLAQQTSSLKEDNISKISIQHNPLPPTTDNLLNLSTPNLDMEPTRNSQYSQEGEGDTDRPYLYPENYSIGQGPNTNAQQAFKGRTKEDVDFAKESINEAMLRTKQVSNNDNFKNSISAIDAGDKQGLAENAQPPIPTFMIEVLENPNDKQVIQVVNDIAKAVNQLTVYHQMTHNRLKFGISQNIAHGGLQSLFNADLQHVLNAVNKMYDNFAIRHEASTVRMKKFISTTTMSKQSLRDKKTKSKKARGNLRKLPNFYLISKKLISI